MPKKSRRKGRSSASSGNRGQGRGLVRSINPYPSGSRVFNSTGEPPNFRNMELMRETLLVTEKRNFGTLVSSTGANTTFAMDIQMSGLSNVAGLAAAFDQYRIIGAEFWIIPRITSNSDAAYNPGRLLTAIDYTDSTPPANEAAMLDYSTCMFSSGVDGHYITWCPRVAGAVLASGPAVVTDVVAPPGQWIDADDLAVQHFGLKVFITQTTTAQTYDMYLRVVAEWRMSN